MTRKTITVDSEVYERLKSHKRGDESFSEALDRILDDMDSDWRMHAEFLSEEDADELEAEVERGREALDESLHKLGDDVDDALRKTDEES